MNLTPQNQEPQRRAEWRALVERLNAQSRRPLIERRIADAKRARRRAQMPKGLRVGKRPPPDDPRLIAAIERGLDLLLRDYLRARDDEPLDYPVWLELLNDDFHEDTRVDGLRGSFNPSGVRYPDDYVLILELMGESPVRMALRHSIRLLGEEVYRLTKSQNAMQETLQRVAGLDSSRAAEREVVMNHAWSGISGNWSGQFENTAQRRAPRSPLKAEPLSKPRSASC